MRTGLIGDIGRCSFHDGPGIRSVVFFKGCPLRCPWCHNPEFLSAEPEIALTPDRCIGCGDCSAVCPEQALQPGRPVRFDRKRCKGCGQCAEVCPSCSLELVGRPYAIEELLEILLQDWSFYEASGGGVTLSGGEPTMQMGFAGELLRSLKREGARTAIETSGFFSWEAFEESLLQWLDLILFDLKLADPQRHKSLIGVDNGLILANLARIARARPEALIVRIPLISGFTATSSNLTALAELMQELGIRRCALMPYHPFGLSKYAQVGRAPTAAHRLPSSPMSPEEVARWQKHFRIHHFIKLFA